MRPAIPSLIGSRFLSCVFGTRCSANGANSFAVRRLLPLAAGLMFNAIGAAYADGGKISDRAPSEISARDYRKRVGRFFPKRKAKMTKIFDSMAGAPRFRKRNIRLFSEMCICVQLP
jgi:hypothetical protein